MKILRPLAAFLGIVLGSSVAIFAGLALTFVVYLLLPEYRDRLSGEFSPLLRAIAWSGVLSGVAAVAFVGELRSHPKRWLAQILLVVVIVAFGWTYWP